MNGLIVFTTLLYQKHLQNTELHTSMTTKNKEETNLSKSCSTRSSKQALNCLSLCVILCRATGNWKNLSVWLWCSLTLCGVRAAACFFFWVREQAEGTNLPMSSSLQSADKIQEVFISVLQLPSLSSFSQQIRGRHVPLLLWTNTCRVSCVPLPGSGKRGEEVLIGAQVFPPRLVKLQTDLLHQTETLTASDAIKRCSVMRRTDQKRRVHEQEGLFSLTNGSCSNFLWKLGCYLMTRQSHWPRELEFHHPGCLFFMCLLVAGKKIPFCTLKKMDWVRNKLRQV